LLCCFLGLLNPGDEAIFFDPSYDCYRSQIQMAGGKAIGLPLKPKKSQSKEQLK
jgi:aspartate/methionine/tyrosine aminotransferase